MRKYIFLVLVIISGCGIVPENRGEDYPRTNYDSLFGIGDSVLTHLYIQQAEQRVYHDSLNTEMTGIQLRLSEKWNIKRREEKRVIFKDTIIYRRKHVTIYDTIHTYIKDTIYIRDTVKIIVEEKRKRRGKRKNR